MIDVILVHTGNSDYLHTTLFALARLNSVNVTLLGDETNAEVAGIFAVKHENISDYKDALWDDIELSYKHNSYLGAGFEKFCFLRFAALNRFADRQGLDRFIYLDSDIIVLNRDILNALAGSLVEKSLGCLTPAATFISAWRRDTLAEFVRFFPTYFSGPPGGDRHCDMFALSEFIRRLGPEHVEASLIKAVPAYDSGYYFKDPNFSFSPILMKQSGVWDYGEVAKVHYNINDFIEFANGYYCYKPYPESDGLNIDFVHLNGNTKFYHEDFGTLIRDSESAFNG